MSRKNIDNSVDGRGRRVGVQRAERKVAGFGDPQRRLDGFQIAHFADQHHVGIFTKRGAQRVGEGLGVGMQLALIHHAVLVHVHEFDRILDGEDVIVPFGVDLVDHRCQRGGLARASRSGHQHQAARLIAQLAHHGRKTKLVERLDLKRNKTKDGRSSAALIEGIGAEASQTLQAEREVELEIFLEAVLLRVGHHAVGQLLGFRRRQLRQIERDQMSVHTNLRR